MLSKNDIYRQEVYLMHDEILSDMVVISGNRVVKNRPCVERDVIVNDVEYQLYDYSNEKKNIYSIMLIPDCFSFSENNSLDDIIMFKSTLEGCNMDRYSFKDGQIIRECYTFKLFSNLAKESISKTIGHYDFDRNQLDKLLESCESAETFFSSLKFIDYLTDNKIFAYSSSITRTHSIKLDSKGIKETTVTKYISFDMTNVDSIFRSFRICNDDSNYTIIEDNKSSLFDLMKQVQVFKMQIKK